MPSSLASAPSRRADARRALASGPRRLLRGVATVAVLALATSTNACVMFPFLGLGANADRPGPVEGSRGYEVVDITGGTVTPNLMLTTVHAVNFSIAANGQETDNGTMVMTSPCNTIAYRYFVPSKGKLRMERPSATTVACEPAIAAIEQAIADILPDLVGWSGPDTALTLRTSDGRRLHLAPAGPRYQLLSVDGVALPVAFLNDAGTVTSVLSDTLVLRRDGLALFRTRTLASGPGGATASTTVLTAQYARVGTDSIRFSPSTTCLVAPCPAVSMTGSYSFSELRFKRFSAGTPVSYRYQNYTPYGT